MKIAGFQRNSFVDYPGKISSVAFTSGCNFNCRWCHNRQLITNEEKLFYTEEFVLSHLKKRIDFISGLVITGGEPTLQKGLEDFIRKVKALGVCVKLDTNGLKPEILERLLSENLLDYVAMDVKAPFEKYADVCDVALDTQKIARSIALLIGDGIDYEFRTTFVPALTGGDVLEIAGIIKGARAFYLQQYRPSQWYKAPPHPPAELRALEKELSPLFPVFGLRGV